MPLYFSAGISMPEKLTGRLDQGEETRMDHGEEHPGFVLHEQA